jgi:hypothetical protein
MCLVRRYRLSFPHRAWEWNYPTFDCTNSPKLPLESHSTQRAPRFYPTNAYDIHELHAYALPLTLKDDTYHYKELPHRPKRLTGSCEDMHRTSEILTGWGMKILQSVISLTTPCKGMRGNAELLTNWAMTLLHRLKSLTASYKTIFIALKDRTLTDMQIGWCFSCPTMKYVECWNGLIRRCWLNSKTISPRTVSLNYPEV